MKRYRIFYSSDIQEPSEFVNEIEGPHISVDLSSLIRHYKTFGRKKSEIRRKVHHIPWEAEWENRNFLILSVLHSFKKH